MPLSPSLIKANPLKYAQSGLQKLNAIEQRLTKSQHTQFMGAHLEQVQKLVRPMVVNFLMQNYTSSGLGTKDDEEYTQTNHLKAALAAVNVVIYYKRGALKMNVIMPRNWAPFPNQKNGDANSFYKAAAALNYGFVTGASGLSARQKASFKARAQGRAITKSQAKGLIGVEEGESGPKTIPPRPYFYLSGNQQEQIRSFVNGYLRQKLAGTRR